MAHQRLERIIHELETLAEDPVLDLGQRRQLHDVTKRVSLQMESPHDTIYRVLYAPNLLVMAEVASDLQIFQTLAADAETPYSIIALAKRTDADAELTGRIARWLAGHGIIEEAGNGTFKANAKTKALSGPGFRGGIKHYVYTTLPPLQALPEFLKQTNHRNPSELHDCPFQKALDTQLTKFEWQKSQPELSTAFGLWMAAQHSSDRTWIDVVDADKLLAERPLSGEAPVFVDVGGGIGHQCSLLRTRLPGLHGRVILQDSTVVIENAPKIAGVERMAHDFWMQQPVKGARAYYLRYIMHDYPDKDCRTILNNLSAAMDNDSVILVDDVVLAEQGAHPYSLDKDIVMMVNFGAMERTTSQWRSLFESCSLKLLQVATYNELSGEAIQVLMKEPRHESLLGN